MATPWWKALKIRPEIINAAGQIDDVQMSLFQAVYGAGAARPDYADAGYYGEITHPTGRLVELLTEIAIRLGGGAGHIQARSLTRLDQGMGGGKSHACIGAYHLAAHPETLLGTELGKEVASQAKARTGLDLPADLNDPHVVVLPCDNMTPGAAVQAYDGPANSLYERFLWRLFSKDYTLYERYQPYWNDKAKIADAIRAINRPLLIIIDELLDYVGNGLDGANRPDLAAQDMAFLRALLDVVNDVPNTALLAVMIASDVDKTALSSAGRDRRDDLNTLLERNGLSATVTEVADFASILRRRLFDADPANEVLASTAGLYDRVLTDKNWSKSVWDAIPSDWRHRWRDEVAACYPFHPMLMSLAKEEWSQVTGFQRVRSTIRIFAATVYAHQQRGLRGDWVPALIGPGDLPLGESTVREALLSSGLVEDDRTTANYRSLAEIEIVGNDDATGTARTQDTLRQQLVWSAANPRAAERAATFIFLTSIVGTLRPGRGRGASAPEVKAATSVPDLSYTLTDADEVVHALVHPERGMSAVEVVPGQGNNKPSRYFLSTRLTYRMLVNNIRRTITDGERDSFIAEAAARLTSTGPFRESYFVPADLNRSATEVLTTAGLDTAHTTRLIVCDPAQFSLRNGAEEETLAALTAAMGLATGPDQLPVQWASSAVFAVVNTQRRALSRNLAVEYLARQRALASPEVQKDVDLKTTGTKDLSDAKSQFERQLRRAFQHVVYLAQPDPDGPRRLDQVAFDDEHSSSLDGTIVWKKLAEREKVLDNGQFTAKALGHNLRENDYGKTLSDLRAAFYSAPRLPLLYGGDRDLQQAINDAVQQGLMEIINGAGDAVAVTSASQVNLASTGLRLARPKVPEPAPPLGDGSELTPPVERPTTPEPDRAAGGSAGPAPQPPTAAEQQVSFSVTRNLLGQQDAADDLAAVYKALYSGLDEGDVTYIQTTLQIVADAEVAQAVKSALERAGISATIKDMG